MALHVPIIDDRRYADLMQALLSELPQLSIARPPLEDEPSRGAWSDHNASQTGVAVVELLAAMGDMVLYRCDHIDQTVEDNFLRLVLDRPEPVTARVRLVRTTPSVPLAALPPGLVFPPESAGRVDFTGAALEFHGVMSQVERDTLIALDPNPPPTAYTDAVTRLHQRSNHVVRIPAGTQLGTPGGERFETLAPDTVAAGVSFVDVTARHLSVDPPFVLEMDGVPVRSTGTAGERFELDTRPLPAAQVLPVLLEPLRARTRTYDPNPRITIQPPAGPTEPWSYVPDFLEAGPDPVFTVDPLTYELVLGDGRRGRIPPAGSTIRVEHLQRVHGAVAQASAAALDRLAETSAALATDPGLAPGPTRYDAARARLVHTGQMTEAERTALLAVSADAAFQAAVETLFETSNLAVGSPADRPGAIGTSPIVGTGGRYLFDHRNAATDGLAALARDDRAVSIRDFESRLEIEFNEQVPDGPRILKAHARRLDDLGTILLVVLPTPGLSDRWPAPGGLLARARLFLDTQRLITTRLVLRGPSYQSFAVDVGLHAVPGTDATTVRQRAIDAVFDLFDPFVGGPHGEGWPMGRPIHPSEIFQRLHETDGVSRVPRLALSAAGSEVASIELSVDGLPRLERDAIAVEVLS